MRNVVITGIGFSTSLGNAYEAFSSALFGNQSGVQSFETRFAGVLPVATVREEVTSQFDRSTQANVDRVGQLGLLAAGRALASAKGATNWQAPLGTGVYAGNGCGPSRMTGQSYEALFSTHRVHALTLLRCMHNSLAGQISINFGLKGPSQVYAAACASSTIAIGEAQRAIRHGYLDTALAGGSESSLGDGLSKAWEAMRVLAPPSGCRPFAEDRAGLVLGEGAVFYVLEAEEIALRRGAVVYAYVSGFGVSCDATHLTEPNPEGQVAAMHAALKDSGRRPDQISYVNAHGTGTKVGDSAEAISLRQVFGARGVPTSSTKPAHGHLLGASGAIELAACIATLESCRAPVTLNVKETDPSFEIDHIIGAPRPLTSVEACLSNSFAFGGTNACLVVSSAP